MTIFRNPTFLRGIYGLFVFLALTINAILTFQFGANYASHAFPFAGTMAFIMGGLFLMLFYDAAAWASLAAYQLAETVQQRGIALWSLVISILASVISSVLQIALTNNLYIVPPNVLDMAGFVALFMMLAVAASHFLCIISYTMTSKQFQKEDADIDLAAKMNSFRLEKRREMAQAVETQVGQLLAAELPNLIISEAEGQLSQMRSLLLSNPAGQKHSTAVDTPLTIDHDDIPNADAYGYAAMPSTHTDAYGDAAMPSAHTDAYGDGAMPSTHAYAATPPAQKEEFTLSEDAEGRRGLTKDEFMGMVSSLFGVESNTEENVTPTDEDTPLS